MNPPEAAIPAGHVLIEYVRYPGSRAWPHERRWLPPEAALYLVAERAARIIETCRDCGAPGPVICGSCLEQRR